MEARGELVLVLDAGTTSTRALAFDLAGGMLAVSQRDLAQFYPRPGWVEHDAAEIWASTHACAAEVVEECGGAGRFAALGIANQRETVVAWDRVSGRPLHRALVWQDRRTADVCATLKSQGHEAGVQQATGLLLDPYFSATKMGWLMDHADGVAEAAASGRLALGTVESWLVWNLTGGLFVSDASNASRTLLMPLTGTGCDAGGWDAGLCDLFGVPRQALGEIVDNAARFERTRPELLGGAIPICGLAGDQQAATIGQGCLLPGQTKATFGTGAFVLTAMGQAAPHSRHRLLSTVLIQLEGQRSYALEGSVFVAGGLVKWLRDSLGLIAAAADTETLARSVPDSAGVVIVPALAGLGAPHWRPEARGVISGLTHGAGRAHIARAALEAMAFQMHDLARAFAADGAEWTRLRIDGGMSVNDWMAQDLADILALPVERPSVVETTALGAAMLAAHGAGLFASLEDAASAMGGPVRHFAPRIGEAERGARLALWSEALARV